MNNRTARLVVIDDIRSVVDMLVQKIPWNEYGIEIVGQAMDGQQGLEIIEREKPDIVLTDIRMPRLSGLEMVEKILQTVPHCKVVIMSGYTDFAYARQAVQLGAVDYVKKPFVIEEITDVIIKARNLWMEEELERISIDKLRKQVEASMPILRQEYLSMLVQFQMPQNKASEYWDFLELGMDPHQLAVMVIGIDDYESKYASVSVKQIELIRFSLQNIIEETVSQHTKVQR